MTKLEEAWCYYTPLGEISHRACFYAGARWALEQMTSEAAVNAWVGCVNRHAGSLKPGPTMQEVLAAVRKEIES